MPKLATLIVLAALLDGASAGSVKSGALRTSHRLEAADVRADPVQVRPKINPKPIDHWAKIAKPGASSEETPPTPKLEVKLAGAAAEKKEEGEASEKKEGEATEKKEGEEKEGEGSAAEGEGENHHSAIVLATGLFSAIVVISLTYIMTQSSDECVKKYTWTTLDMVVAIFLAVMWYQVVDDVIVDSEILPKSHAILALMLYSAILLFAVFGTSYVLKGRPTDLAIFCASGAHFVSFASMHTATEFLSHHASATPLRCFIGVLTVIIGYVIICVAAFFFKKRLRMGDELMDKVDDVENDFGAMAVGICWTMFVYFVISGSLQEIEDPEENASAKERDGMLSYGFILLAVCAGIFYAVRKLEASQSYPVKRIRMFIGSFMSISVAWAFIFWAKSELRSKEHAGTELQGHLSFAIVMSLVAMGLIWGLSKIPRSATETPIAKREFSLVLGTLGLMTGWAWEETFDEAVEAMAESVTGVDTAMLKFGLAVSLGAFVLPAYVWYLKPTTMKMGED